MYYGRKNPDKYQYCEELKKLIGKPIPQIEKIESSTFGFKVEGDNIIELGFYNQ